MRMVVLFQLPIEPFNSMVRDGTAGEALQRVLGDIRPEAVYFMARDGHRGGVMIVDLESASQLPAVAEPLFLSFNATVEVHPTMTPEDLAAAGLDELGARYG